MNLPKRLFWLFAFVFISNTALANTFNVSTGAAFQIALTTAASNGEDDTIILAAGTYDASADGITPGAQGFTYLAAPGENYSLTVQGAGQDSTILTGAGKVQVLSIITENTTDDSGKSIQVSHLNAVDGLSAFEGAGIALRSNSASLVANELTLQNNQTVTEDISGGGLTLLIVVGGENSTILLENSRFENNHTEDQCSSAPDCANGGGAQISTVQGSSIASVEVVNNTFLNNSANAGGGLSVKMSDLGTLNIEQNIFEGNVADVEGADAGGGLLIGTESAQTVVVNQNTFTENSSVDVGGGLWSSGLPAESIVISNNLFNENMATGAGGFGLITNSPSLQVVNNIIVNNVASLELLGVGASGGGMVLLGGEGLNADVTNNTITGNRSLIAAGGGIATSQFEGSTAHFNIYNNIIFGNTGVGAGQDIYLASSVNLDPQSVASSESEAGIFITLNSNDYSDYFNGCSACSVTLTSNIQADPLFTNPSGGDYSLQNDSPCIGTANPLAPAYPVTDFLGDSRALSADMGALEGGPSSLLSGACNAQISASIKPPTLSSLSFGLYFLLIGLLKIKKRSFLNFKD